MSFETEIFPTLIGNGLYGMRVDGYWLDIGTPERYLQATRDILDGTVETSVEPTVESHLIAPSIAGEGCEISAGATVGPYASLGAGCTIAEGAVVEHSALHDGVEVEAGAVVRDSIVGAGARVGAGRRRSRRRRSSGPGSFVDAEATLQVRVSANLPSSEVDSPIG